MTVVAEYTLEELQAAKGKLADSWLNKAREVGYLAIGQTLKGTVNLTYENRVYTLTQMGMPAILLAGGKRSVVKEVLISICGED